MRENYLQFRKIPHESEAFQSRGKKEINSISLEKRHEAKVKRFEDKMKALKKFSYVLLLSAIG